APERNKVLPKNRIFDALPTEAKDALTYYLANLEHYEDLNRIFRGLPPTNSNKNILGLFLCACLINWAAEAAKRSLLHLEERNILENLVSRLGGQDKLLKMTEVEYKQSILEMKQHGLISDEEYQVIENLFNELYLLFPSYTLLTRGELFDSDETGGHLAVEKQRLANPVHSAAITSISASTKGLSFFRKNDKTQWSKFETSHNTRPIANPVEAEVLLPHGLTLQYVKNPDGDLIVREINSPDILPFGNYWSLSALAFAYEHYLSKPYSKAQTQQITINNILVYRPNHGLPHTYRVMKYLDMLRQYFAYHAKDPEFRAFCQKMSFSTHAWLLVTAAFSVTGRENEVSAIENITEYEAFKANSQKNMARFVEIYPHDSKNKQEQKSMLHIARWLGHPDYETTLKARKDAVLPNETKADEKIRFFNHRILNFAHKLDLVRCYSPKQFEYALASQRELIQESANQQAAYLGLIKYAIDLNRAHGNRLQTDISANNTLIQSNLYYHSPFEHVSHNLRQLREITNSVPELKLKPPKSQAAGEEKDKYAPPGYQPS
ncbi:MAG: SidE phosphodiesterase domain-containing protein, partial [Gammaproteobacteria bacterium]|nr:SidE phosphodiesterase domain-containing protein [Gammaproteobacteria bacterium]